LLLGHGRRADAGNLDRVAEKTKIPELRRTTRDEPDYDKLMNYRLGILAGTASTLAHPGSHRPLKRCGRQGISR